MMQPALHSTPRWRDVLIAQVRGIGIALRMPARVALALVTIVSLLVAAEIVGNGKAIDFHPEHYVLPGVLGLLLPISVWKNEDRFGAAFLWTLPVDRARHALVKVLAGWLWLMSVVVLFELWLLAATLTSGASPFAEETRRVLPTFSYGATFDPSAIQDVRWTPKPLLWLVPFTAATGTYVLASALALGARHPLRWIVGVYPRLLSVRLRGRRPGGSGRQRNGPRAECNREGPVRGRCASHRENRVAPGRSDPDDG